MKESGLGENKKYNFSGAFLGNHYFALGDFPPSKEKKTTENAKNISEIRR